MALKANVAANFLGQGWLVVISFAFVPVYIKLLGIEAYGIISIFAMMQAWLALLDVGLRPTISRELARFSSGARDIQSTWALLRSVECVVIAAAIIAAAGIHLLSNWIAPDWLHPNGLEASEIQRAFSIMGVVAALQFVYSLYNSCLAGLQKQVILNVVSSIVISARSFGAVAVLYFLSPTIEAFFIWQGAVSVASAGVLAAIVHRLLPQPPVRPPVISLAALREVSTFAGGTAAISILAVVLAQIDKLVLARLIPLDTFACYALAGTVTVALGALAAPIFSAFYPRLTQLACRADRTQELRDAYHLGAQMITVVSGSIAVLLFFFGPQILAIWLADTALAGKVDSILRILVWGGLLNALLSIPLALQLAYGWTSLNLKLNLVAVPSLIVGLFVFVPAYQAVGAAWCWVVVCAAKLLVTIPLMHRRLLKDEIWSWFLEDLCCPVAAAVATAAALHAIQPSQLNLPGALIWLGSSSLLILATAALSASRLRPRVIAGIQNIRLMLWSFL